MNPWSVEVQYLSGVGEHRAHLLAKLNIHTIGDLIESFPRAYINRKTMLRVGDLEIDRQSAIIGKVQAIDEHRTSRGKRQLNVSVTDGEAVLMCTWFRYGKWLTEQLEEGASIWVSGMVSGYHGMPQIIHPEFEILDAEDAPDDFWKNRLILPIYPLTDKLTVTIMRKLVVAAFQKFHAYIPETLPEHILQHYDFPPRKAALEKMHFPVPETDIEKVRQRFIYEEFFYHQLLLARVYGERKKNPTGVSLPVQKTFTTQLKNILPFRLTKAQQRVIREIVHDMESTSQMNRLLQGDVGSGKTIVTLFAMLLAVENGYQAVLMAPTEILAEQHFHSATNLLENQPELRIALLKGGNYKGKKATLEKIAAGEIDLVFGTHALIQKKVRFHNIGFICIDEQHRFGVRQRALLSEKGERPNLLHMSATPIPRSLAMTAFGDLDVSVIDEMPPGRKPIHTVHKNQEHKFQIYNEMRKELRKGRQAYLVCPLVEESEKSYLLDSETLYKDVSENIFPEYASALLHGRMKSREKDEIMHAFKQKEFSILVATTVIEVGIDVPNATMMVIEHAERFGLSQLHQLRGRVGRGAEQSSCYLIYYPPISHNGWERISTMAKTNDGFDIAEKDLDLRGPGDFFGTRQSGMPDFRHANLLRHQEWLKLARKDAFDLVSSDPKLEKPENQTVREQYDAFYLEREELIKY